MSPSLRSAFRNLIAALIGVLDAATHSSRASALALHLRFLVGLRRRVARLAGMSQDEVVARFPERRDTVPSEQVAKVIALRPVEERKQRKVAERRDSSMFDSNSVVPPNIERAITSQLRASHRTRMKHDDLIRFVAAFGVARGDARGALTVLRARTRRDYVVSDDLQDIQAWIGKGWIDSRKRNLGATMCSVVRRQLELADDAALTADVVAEVLVARGYRVSTASDIASKLCAGPAYGFAG